MKIDALVSHILEIPVKMTALGFFTVDLTLFPKVILISNREMSLLSIFFLNNRFWERHSLTSLFFFNSNKQNSARCLKMRYTDLFD